MKTSNKGIKLIKEFEGCRLTAYKCPAGVWTIGYGHTGKVDGKAVSSGMKITAEKAEELLEQDLETYEKAVFSCKDLTFKPNQNQFDALVSFTYNCGAGNLSTLVKGRDAATISQKILLYTKANGKELAGLVRRRKAEKELFDTAETESEKNTSAASKKSAGEIAEEVISGKWGNGEERKKNLEAAGYNYDEVQAKVSAKLKGETKTETDTKTGTTTSTNSKVDSAEKFDKPLSGTYTVTASSLNLRKGAGTGKAILTSMPKGSTVQCYGYYTNVSDTKWLYVVYGKYTGFASSSYLKKKK